MFVYRHYSKGSDRHAERERKEGRRKRERCMERNTGKEKRRGRKKVPVLLVTDNSRGCGAWGTPYPTTTSLTVFFHPHLPHFPEGQRWRAQYFPSLYSRRSVLQVQPVTVPWNPEHLTLVEWARKRGLKERVALHNTPSPLVLNPALPVLSPPPAWNHFQSKAKKKKKILLFLLHPTLWHRLAVGEGTGGKLIVAATDQKDQSSTTNPSL